MRKKINGIKKFSQPKPQVPLSPVKRYFHTVLRTLLIFLIIFVVSISAIFGFVVITYISSADRLTPDDLAIKGFSSVVYDMKGELIMGLSSGKNREMVDSKDIPQHLKDAFVAIEDKRFYTHPGIDIIRIGSAIVSSIVPGMTSHGGSTITQQVIKNATGEDQHSIKRKIQEQWRALELEKSLSKDQILELYLNLIYMGENCYGVQAASKIYFDKDVKDLTLAEAASLAGITNLPAAYDPFLPKGKENNLKRQKIILKEMLKENYITQAEYDKAIKEEVKFSATKKALATEAYTQPYFVDQVVSDVKKDLMSKGYSEDIALKTIYNNGLKIYTTMDKDVQEAMDSVFTSEKYFSVISRNAGTPQGAMVIIDPKNGQVRALYGGSGKKVGSPLNRASSILMQRQPGSTFKPIAVYGPAINEKKITAATIVDDVPVYLNGINNRRYPENYDLTYKGLTNIRDGIRDSLNVVAAKTWTYNLGANLSLKYLSKVNIDRTGEGYVSMSLGGLKTGVNPLQMAAAYVPFANRGLFFEPTTYTRVEDRKGNILLEKKIKSTIVYDEAAAFIMTSMLKDVPRIGTAYPYGLIQNGAMPSAGKTGTTSDNKDKWYLGFTPYYVGATWYGYDKPTTLSPAEYNRALSIWHDVMEKVHKNLKPVDFPMPQGIVKKTICIYSGKTPSGLCSKDSRGNAIREEYFIKGTEPSNNQICDAHVELKVCSDSKDIFGRNLLFGSYCPATSLVNKVFVKRKEPYVSKKFGDPYPADRAYEPPYAEYCNIHGSPLSGLSDTNNSRFEVEDKEEGKFPTPSPEMKPEE